MFQNAYNGDVAPGKRPFPRNSGKLTKTLQHHGDQCPQTRNIYLSEATRAKPTSSSRQGRQYLLHSGQRERAQGIQQRAHGMDARHADSTPRLMICDPKSPAQGQLLHYDLNGEFFFHRGGRDGPWGCRTIGRDPGRFGLPCRGPAKGWLVILGHRATRIVAVLGTTPIPEGEGAITRCAEGVERGDLQRHARRSWGKDGIPVRQTGSRGPVEAGPRQIVRGTLGRSLATKPRAGDGRGFLCAQMIDWWIHVSRSSGKRASRVVRSPGRVVILRLDPKGIWGSRKARNQSLAEHRAEQHHGEASIMSQRMKCVAVSCETGAATLGGMASWRKKKTLDRSRPRQPGDRRRVDDRNRRRDLSRSPEADGSWSSEKKGPGITAGS